MMDIKVGDSVVDILGDPGIVVKIIPGVDAENHGTIYVWQSEKVGSGADNCGHYCYFEWEKTLRIL